MRTRFVYRDTAAYTMYLNDRPVAVVVRVPDGTWVALSLPDGHRWSGPTRKAIAEAIAKEVVA